MTVINRTDLDLDVEGFIEALEEILREEVGRTDVILVFVNEDEIARLNSEYRGESGPTDVLTFLYDDEDSLGEIVVCPSYVEKNAREYGVPFKEELLRVLIHGTLHLCGYDHEFDESRADEMFKRQEEYLKKFKYLLDE